MADRVIASGVPVAWDWGTTSFVQFNTGPMKTHILRSLTWAEVRLLAESSKSRSVVEIVETKDGVEFRAAEPRKEEIMSERVVVSGVPRVVRFEPNHAEVWFDILTARERYSGFVSDVAAMKALEAMREKREVEIVEVDGVRTVRVLPEVVVKARGAVKDVNRPRRLVWLDDDVLGRSVDDRCVLVAARAMADDAEVEIVSIDGGPDQVRVCK